MGQWVHRIHLKSRKSTCAAAGSFTRPGNWRRRFTIGSGVQKLRKMQVL
jgi:hypothetical protein